MVGENHLVHNAFIVNSIVSRLYVHKNGGSAIADNLRRIICKRHNIYLKKIAVNNYRTCARHLWSPGCGNLGKEDWFDFTFSRNPWDRYVSMWSYTLKRKQLKTKRFGKAEKNESPILQISRVRHVWREKMSSFPCRISMDVNVYYWRNHF